MCHVYTHIVRPNKETEVSKKVSNLNDWQYKEEVLDEPFKKIDRIEREKTTKQEFHYQ